MNPERLVAMANDIANFFAAEPERQLALDGVVAHLRRYWEPRMRRQFVAHVQAHGVAGLSELAAAAAQRLAQIEAKP